MSWLSGGSLANLAGWEIYTVWIIRFVVCVNHLNLAGEFDFHKRKEPSTWCGPPRIPMHIAKKIMILQDPEPYLLYSLPPLQHSNALAINMYKPGWVSLLTLYRSSCDPMAKCCMDLLWHNKCITNHCNFCKSNPCKENNIDGWHGTSWKLKAVCQSHAIHWLSFIVFPVWLANARPSTEYDRSRGSHYPTEISHWDQWLWPVSWWNTSSENKTTSRYIQKNVERSTLTASQVL